jgi:phosphotriesterase-related protein
MEALVGLLEHGYGNQVVVGHDVGLKVQTRRFGGLGYDHIFRRVAPALTAHYGVADADIHAILVDTPRRLLTVQTPAGQPSGTMS